MTRTRDKRSRDTRPDEDFLPGKVEYLVAGNKGRMLDARRAPFEVVKRLPKVGMWQIVLLDFEDKGSLWEIPYEDVTSYQFELDSREAPIQECIRIVQTILTLNKTISIPLATSMRDSTIKEIQQDRLACKKLLRKAGITGFMPETYIKKMHGSKQFYNLLEDYMRAKGLKGIDEHVTAALVTNPYSGELIKGCGMVLAELGLTDYTGKILRDEHFFEDEYSKAAIAKYLTARLAFTHELWSLSGLSQVVLYRAFASERQLVPMPKSLVSTSFSEKIALEIYEGTSLTQAAVLLRQKVPLERLFMTFLETAAMNRQFYEAEAVLLSETNNLAF